ncbi:MAG TPA: hypothetical protein ENH84_07930 [Phycisphaerae bacterium]|nr:hypothetical protein [Phycisphaerae bacterium]
MDKTDTEQIGKSLAFVRDVVQRQRKLNPVSFALYVMWGVILAGGMMMVDFYPRAVGLYWVIMGTVGWTASLTFGWWGDRHYGHLGGPSDRRETLHWVIMSLSVVVFVLIAWRTGYTGRQYGSCMFLLLGLACLLAGVHCELAWFVPGLLFVTAALLSVFAYFPYLVSATGVAVCISLIVGLVFRNKARA